MCCAPSAEHRNRCHDVQSLERGTVQSKRDAQSQNGSSVKVVQKTTVIIKRKHYFRLRGLRSPCGGGVLGISFEKRCVVNRWTFLF